MHRTLSAACTTGLLLSALALAGCGSRSSSQPAMTPAAATNHPKVPNIRPPRVLRGQETPRGDSDDESDGVLVVSKEIVQACSELQAVKREASHIDPEEVWLVVLEGLANCMTDGDLKSRSVRVTGDDQGREIVKRVLSARGVPLSRVNFVSRASGNGRVDITLLPADGSETTL